MGIEEEAVRVTRREETSRDRVVALAGNPNVGKSTVFNKLTGLRQHTGNWPGKTVEVALGKHRLDGRNINLVDLPGTYSLSVNSAEEEIAREFICNGGADAVVVIVDATCLERNLNLVLQTVEITDRVVVCVNLMDEAKKKGIRVDLELLQQRLGIPVVGTSARNGVGLEKLMDTVGLVADGKLRPTPIRVRSQGDSSSESDVVEIVKACERIFQEVVSIDNKEYAGRDRKIDRLLTSKTTGYPVMILLLFVVFWITITGANYPSQLLSHVLFSFEPLLQKLMTSLGAPEGLVNLLTEGGYRTLAWVVSVMLPPMAIFFPLFTLLEDCGYLPRIAFNLDNFFRKACAHGKQALTMCMGFGCNAAGVIGCRIIDSPRERLIAIITNNFVPCNGRFPTLIALITMFLVGTSGGFLQSAVSTLMLTGIIVLAVSVTIVTSRILSKTLLRGEPSSFYLELPPYRRPQIGRVIVRSILDRTLYVLGRAVVVALPAGLIIWVFANTHIDGISILNWSADILDPLARLMGLDGYILLAFILGFPANEIVVPIIIMSYMSKGALIELDSLAELRALFVENGWSWLTAACTMLFSLMHWPCSTTCLTIRKETGSTKWTLVSFLVPTVVGVVVCITFATVVRTFGFAP